VQAGLAFAAAHQGAARRTAEAILALGETLKNPLKNLPWRIFQ
jgi:hypothetical protein